MPSWSSYSSKNSPDNTDTLMIKDNVEAGNPNKQLSFLNLWNWVMSKTYAFTQGTKTIPAAINETQNNSIYNYGTGLNSSYTSCNEIIANSVIFISSAGGTTSLSDYAFNAAGWLMTINVPNSTVGVFQLAYPYNTALRKPHIRSRVSGTWNSWIPVSNDIALDDTLSVSGKAADSEVVGNVIKKLRENGSASLNVPWSNTTGLVNGVTYTYDSNTKTFTVSGTATSQSFRNQYNNVSSLPSGVSVGDRCYLHINSTDSNIGIRIFFYNSSGQSILNLLLYESSTIIVPGDAVGMIVRINVLENVTVNGTIQFDLLSGAPNNSVVDYTRTLTNDGLEIVRNYSSCNDIKSNSIIFIGSSGGSTALTDYAFDGAGWLMTISVPGSNIGFFQLALPYDPSSRSVYVRSCNLDIWGEWVKIGEGISYNVTQNINRDEITNTYNITTTPTITTSSNGWLAAIDDSSTAQTSATDMTGSIMSMLTNTGYCHLGPGVFYVSGSIVMPEGSTLEGCGGKTVIRLLNSVDSGYVIQPTKKCTIKNITFYGGDVAPSDIHGEEADLGSRHCIYMVANADGDTQYASISEFGNIISECTFFYFDGSAIYLANTGGSAGGVVEASNINIRYCKVGINVDYRSEYNKFTNVIIYRCNHACINNGGNNTFVNCSFNGVVGFVMDNTDGTKSNNAHGTCSGCTFNHINAANNPSGGGMGNAIVVKNMANGFIFSACQLWYGEIVVENSRGIAFSDCLIGGGTPSITVTGSYPAFFSGCIFHATPNITVVAGTKFNNCYLDSNGSQIP